LTAHPPRRTKEPRRAGPRDGRVCARSPRPRNPHHRDRRSAREHVESSSDQAQPADERGQALGITVLFLVALLGMAGLVIDVGSWYVKDHTGLIEGVTVEINGTVST
jgi:hypothetical protein